MAKKATKVVRKLEPTDKKYELVLVLQPELLESAAEKKLKEFEKFLTDQGGTVEMKDVWGKQKLAYKIGKHSAGIYVVYNLVLPTTSLKEIDEHMRIEKDFIRTLIVSLKDGYEYRTFEEEIPAPSKEETPGIKPRSSSGSHKSTSSTKSEVKDKGVKADSKSLDNKLDAIIGGDDINV